MADITSANAVLMFTIPGLFSTPQQLQGFAVDDVYDIDAIEAGETMQGVDGLLSGGFVFAPVNQGIAFMADSASGAIFDTWYAAERQTIGKLPAQATLTLPALKAKWTQTKGFLVTYVPLPSAKRVLQPRKHIVRWESVVPAPFSA